MRKTALAIAALVSAGLATIPAASAPLSVRDSFRIGTGGDDLLLGAEPRHRSGARDMFDAGYS